MEEYDRKKLRKYPECIKEEEWSAFLRIDSSALDNSKLYAELHKFESSLVKTKEDLWNIWAQGGYLTQEWDWHTYCPTKPDDLERSLARLFSQTEKRPGMKACDLGIGTGYVQAAFAAAGFQTYGIDNTKQALDHAMPYFAKVQEALGREFQYAPTVVSGDVLAKDFSRFCFPDGTTLKDNDIFFCYIGDNRAHWKRIMKNLGRVKPGSIWCTEFILFVFPEEHMHSIVEGRELSLRDTQFRPLDRRNQWSLLVAKG